MRRPTRDQITAILTQALDKAFAVQTPAVHAHIGRVSENHPNQSPAGLIEHLEKQCLLSVTALGGAAVPGGDAAVAV